MLRNDALVSVFPTAFVDIADVRQAVFGTEKPDFHLFSSYSADAVSAAVCFSILQRAVISSAANTADTTANPSA